MVEFIGSRQIKKFDQEFFRFKDLETGEEYLELCFKHENKLVVCKTPKDSKLVECFVNYKFQCSYKNRDKRWELGYFPISENSKSITTIQNILGYVGKLRQDVDPQSATRNVIYFDVCKQMSLSLKGREMI